MKSQSYSLEHNFWTQVQIVVNNGQVKSKRKAIFLPFSIWGPPFQPLISPKYNWKFFRPTAYCLPYKFYDRNMSGIYYFLKLLPLVGSIDMQ